MLEPWYLHGPALERTQVAAIERLVEPFDRARVVESPGHRRSVSAYQVDLGVERAVSSNLYRFNLHRLRLPMRRRGRETSRASGYVAGAITTVRSASAWVTSAGSKLLSGTPPCARSSLKAQIPPLSSPGVALRPPVQRG